MSKIIVTGGAGFIGSHVVDQYVEAGHDVVVVDDLSSGFEKNLNPKAQFHNLDIRDKAMEDLFKAEQPEYIMHLAAQIDVRRSVQEPLFDADVNVRGTIWLLELALKYKVKKFIFASTGGAIYGEPENLPADESTIPRPLCHYGCAKYCAEQYIQLYNTLYGQKFTVLRFPNVYGPRQCPEGEAGVCSILTGLMLEGKQPVLYGHGTPLRDYVYVGDIAKGALLALDKGDNGVYNLGSAKGTTVQEVFDIIKEATGYEGDAKLEDLRSGEVNKIFISGDRALADLGWKAEMDIRQGLINTVEYIKTEEA